MNKQPFLRILKSNAEKLETGFTVKLRSKRPLSWDGAVFYDVEAVKIESEHLDEFPNYITNYKGVIIRNAEEIGYIEISADEIEEVNGQEAESYLKKAEIENKRPLWTIEQSK